MKRRGARHGVVSRSQAQRLGAASMRTHVPHIADWARTDRKLVSHTYLMHQNKVNEVFPNNSVHDATGTARSVASGNPTQRSSSNHLWIIVLFNSRWEIRSFPFPFTAPLTDIRDSGICKNLERLLCLLISH
ncbi:hypothetical protein J6590_002201 [Homalodisca vitripennis]|nr:hypothetical protein J6590_002201 [Homalodisca vitripennis]